MGKRAASRKASTFQNINMDINLQKTLLITLAVLLVAIAIGLGLYFWPKTVGQDQADKNIQKPEITSKKAIIEEYNKSNYKNVIPGAENYLKSNKDDLKMREILASSYLLTGNSKKSLAEYQLILESKPSDAETLYKIGILQQRMGKQSEALSYLSRAVRAAPNVILFHAELARVSANSNYYPNAVEEWKSVLNLLPPADKARATVLAEIANLYILQDDLIQAKGIIATGLALDPSNETLRALEAKTGGPAQATPGLPGVWSGEN